MGPRLGPLIVTSVLARASTDAARKLATSKPRGALAARIGDSKKLVAFEDASLGEAWARAIVARSSGDRPASASEALSRLAIDATAELTGACPSHHRDQCWGAHDEALVASEEVVAACERDLTRLAARGLEVLHARVAIICARRLNDAVDEGLSRFDVDLHTMERLALAAREDAGEDVHALCGKVGGFGFYGARFGPLAGRLHTVLHEGRARSDYQVPGLGRLSFVRDADDAYLLVGLASLVGKWVRDHLMRRIVHFYRAHVPDAPDASGYHDPVTARFIDQTAIVRKRLRVEDRCFERRALHATTPRG